MNQPDASERVNTCRGAVMRRELADSASFMASLALVGVSIVGVGGCCHDGGGWPWACGPRIASGAVPPTIGTYVCEWQTAQAEAAEKDDGVIYQYEWQGSTAELGPYGNRHLAQLAHRLNEQPLRVLIEPSDNRETDDARRAVVIEYLQKAGVEQADALVRVAGGDAEGLYGDEAQRLSRSYLLDGSRGGGAGMGGGGGGMGGGMGGMSGGMGGTGGGIQ